MFAGPAAAVASDFGKFTKIDDLALVIIRLLARKWQVRQGCRLSEPELAQNIRNPV
jgi:hypothetical protein